MINVTSQYAAQVFLSPASSQIQTQVDAANSSNIPTPLFIKTYKRTSQAGTAPDGSLAVMYQVDALLNQDARYAYQSVRDAQRAAQEAAASTGNEYYIEISPIPTQYYSILTWASNL